MVWVSTIDELDFYSRGASDYCYCDLLIQPNDLAIQGNIGKNSAASTLRIYIYTPDGKTQLDEVTIYFDWYIAKAAGFSFFNARLKFFPEIMCDNRCFVLRAVVTSESRTVFDMWTEQYCLADCCTLPEQVIIEGLGITTSTPKIPADVTSPKDSACRPLLRMQVGFDCIDNWNGNYYGIPPGSDWINGSVPFNKMFAFTNILNITGSVLDLPRELKRTISINCNVQRSESTALFDVQSFEEFPVWKMNEISDMLHAPLLILNGEEYNYPGGTPFETLYPKKLRKRYFRLKMTVQDCLIFQNYGCGEKCVSASTTRFYAFEGEADTYYDDSGITIGKFEDVVNWFENSGGGRVLIEGPSSGGTPPTGSATQGEVAIAGDPWDVEIYDQSMLPGVTIPFFRVIEATGEGLPAYIYGDTTRPAGRIYGQEIINGDPNSLFGVGPNHVECQPPQIGVPTFADMVCQNPVLGTITYIDLCQKPVIGVIVYGDLPIEPPVSLTDYILPETGDGKIIAENGDFLIQE